VVAGIERCVGAVTGSGRVGDASYEFAVDEKRFPTLTVKVAGKPDREIAWDPATRLIVRDGEWTYEIEGGGNPVANAAIGRVNGAKQREFWHWDGPSGRETVRSANGVERTRHWFVSGPLRNQTRRVEENGKVLYRYSFDALGRPFRVTSDSGGMQVILYKNLVGDHSFLLPR
jgi:hypothetical protein